MIRAKGAADSIQDARSSLKNGSFGPRNEIFNKIYRLAIYSLRYIVQVAASKNAFDRRAQSGATQLTSPVRISRLDPQLEHRI